MYKIFNIDNINADKKMLEKSKNACALSMVVLIAACGGGGGNNESTIWSCAGNQNTYDFNITSGQSNTYSCVRANATSAPVVDNTGKCCKSYTYQPSTQTYTPHYVQIGQEGPSGGVVCTNINADYACQ